MEALFTELDRHIQENELEKALSVCDKILSQAPTDADALACKGQCLIQLSKFEEAFSFFSEPAVSSKNQFELAYCQYKLRKFTDALTTLSKISNKSTQELSLEAQILYSSEDFSKSADIYQELLTKHKIDTPELQTNYSAALMSAGRFSDCLKYVEANKSTLKSMYEFAYNAACAYILQSDLPNAEKYLVLAQDTCNKNLNEEDFTEEEIQEELNIINVQLAYIYQLQGKSDEATELYNKIVDSDPSDIVVNAVASNNLISIRNVQHHDTHDFEKKMKIITKAKTDEKLTAIQKQISEFNRCLLYLYENKAKQSKELLNSLTTQYPDSPMIPLIKSALLFRSKKVADAEQLLKECIAKVSASKSDTVSRDLLKAQLSLAQLHLAKSNYQEVINILLSLPDITYRAGVASVLISLYDQVSNSADSFIQSLMKFWEKNKDTEKNQYREILILIGNYRMKKREYKDAADIFSKLVEIGGKDQEIENLAKVVVASAEVNVSMAEKYGEKLGAVPVASDVSESLGVGIVKKSDDGEEKRGPEDEQKKKKKKKRKIRYPKGYDPSSNTKPNPERWLPLRERSTYKPKKGKKGLGRGPQGASPASADAKSRSTTQISAAKASVGRPTGRVKRQRKGRF